jgi:hypothetical protein
MPACRQTGDEAVAFVIPAQSNQPILSRSEPYVNRVNKACFGRVPGGSGSKHGEVT